MIQLLKKLFFWVLAIALALLVADIVIAFLVQHTPVKFAAADNRSRVEISYVDFISIMLTAVSVILATLAFVITILATIGWRSIGDRAAQATQRFLEEGFSDGGRLHRMIVDETKKAMYSGVQKVEAAETEIDTEAITTEADTKTGGRNEY